LDDDEANAVEDNINLCFDITQALLEEVVPYSIQYYLGVKAENDADFEDEDDDDFEDDDDDEDEKPVKKGKKPKKKSDASDNSGKGTKGGKKVEGKPEECKQQ
jgi:nucleosome assembly protein 1-like 1